MPFIKIEATNVPRIHNDQRYLFIANHQSRIDPFLAFVPFSYSQMSAAAPTRFLTAGGIYYSFLYPVLKCCGCFPTRKKDSSYSAVKASVHYLNHGQNVFIFPEGKRVLRSESRPRDGVTRIINQASDSNLLLVLIKLQWTKRRFGKRLRVTYDVTTPDSSSANEIMGRIYSL